MKKVLLIVSLLFCSVAWADQGDLSVVAGSYTDHLKEKTFGSQHEGKNPNTWAIGLNYEPIEKLEVGVGYYYNSIYQNSEYASVAYRFLNYKNFNLALEEQAANGYSRSLPNGGSTTDMYYRTNIRACYKTDFMDKFNPELCVKTNIAQSSGSAFDQLIFFVKVPLANF
jgi:hypothetical protein